MCIYVYNNNNIIIIIICISSSKILHKFINYHSVSWRLEQYRFQEEDLCMYLLLLHYAFVFRESLSLYTTYVVVCFCTCWSVIFCCYFCPDCFNKFLIADVICFDFFWKFIPYFWHFSIDSGVWILDFYIIWLPCWSIFFILFVE